jgi:hypothetical protein
LVEKIRKTPPGKKIQHTYKRIDLVKLLPYSKYDKLKNLQENLQSYSNQTAQIEVWSK